jgi:hypothetical protein
VTVTRRHHPLLHQQFEVLNGNKTQLVILLRDGSSMRIPRAWTDVDGALPSFDGEPATYLTVASLRELAALVDLLLSDRR